MPRYEKIIIGALIMIMLVWMIYTQVFAPFEAKQFIGIYHIDKIIHFLGGVFLGLLFLRYVNRGFLLGALVFFVIATIWEIFEIFAIPDVAFYFEQKRDLWIVDTVLDYIVGFAGFLAVLFFKKRDTLHERTMQPIGGLAAFHQRRVEQKERAKVQILDLIRTRREIQNNDVEALLGVSDATATRYLQELEEEGLLSQEGNTKGAMYRLK